MSARPKTDWKTFSKSRKCPNCLQPIQGWYDHWVRDEHGDGDDDFTFNCEYHQPDFEDGHEAVRQGMNLARAFDRAITEYDRAYWKDYIEELWAKEEAENPPPRWWETAAAVLLFGPVLGAMMAYAWLDDKLRKRGV